MSFKQKIIILGSVIAGLSIIYIVGLIFTNMTFGSYNIPLFPNIKTNEITSIAINDPNGSVKLEKTGDSWTVIVGENKFDGDANEIDKLVTSVSTLATNRIASKQNGAFEQFQVDDKNAVHAVFSGQNGTLMDIYIGKSGADGISQFVRLPGSNEVLQTTDRIIFSSRTREWVARKFIGELTSFTELEKIHIDSRIGFNNAGNLDPSINTWISYTINHKVVDTKSEFSLEGDTAKKLLTNEVNKMLYAIFDFRMEDVITEPDKYVIDPNAPMANVVLTFSGGKTLSMEICGKSKENETLLVVRNPAKSYYYTAMSWNLKKVIVPLDSLIQKEQVK